MATTTARQAVLIVTQEISKHVLKLYNNIRKSLSSNDDIYILFHNRSKEQPVAPPGVNVEVFTNDVMKTLGYRPIRTRLVPGSNHFPVLQFFLNHPEYQHYWCIEDDVVFSGDWKDFFGPLAARPELDFVTSHIRRYADLPDWFWWDTYREPGKDFEPDQYLNSFNPVYRISNGALKFIDGSLKNGFRGHHEVLLPTLLHKSGFQLADLGSKENHVTPILSLCTLTSMRWKPVFFRAGSDKNKLYHPVKANIGMSQVMDYLERTLKKKTEYLS